jgi:predicted extracellular nuclease
MNIDWLKCVGKTVIISITGDDDIGVYAQKIALPIIAVVELSECERSVRLITVSIEIQGEDVSETTNLFEVNTKTGVVVAGIAIGEEEEKYYTDARGTIVEVY